MMSTRAARCALLAWLSLTTAACSARGDMPAPPQAPRPAATEPVGLLPSPTAEPAAPLSTPTVPPPVEANAQALVQAFVSAPYRVVAVASSPFAPYALIVANERAPSGCGDREQPRRCVADETCGSLHTAPTCFFFIEPMTSAAGGEPGEATTRYVTRWPDTPGENALATDSLRFIDGRTVEFRARNADETTEEVWWLDLVTGAAAMQSRR